MQWSDVTARPSARTLRQFAALFLIVFAIVAGLRVWGGDTGTATIVIAGTGVVIGLLGLVRPDAIRYVYTSWMIAAFPIGWTISRVIVMLLFYVVFTPFALVFRLIGRDALRRRRHTPRTYWMETNATEPPESYYGQF
jgi:saxitoxin biosynthesis operon SxtJ-like protein